MFRIRLTDFRCFTDAPPVELRPITFLVGENSAGKTTFMAASRLLFESFSRAPQNPFNREPYRLGGFDQIAHYRGGSPGRAKSFSLELIALPPSDISTTRQRGRAPSIETRHKFSFVKGTPQPELSEYEFAIPGMVVTLNVEEDAAVLKIERNGLEVLRFKPEGGPPAKQIRALRAMPSFNLIFCCRPCLEGWAALWDVKFRTE